MVGWLLHRNDKCAWESNYLWSIQISSKDHLWRWSLKACISGSSGDLKLLLFSVTSMAQIWNSVKIVGCFSGKQISNLCFGEKYWPRPILSWLSLAPRSETAPHHTEPPNFPIEGPAHPWLRWVKACQNHMVIWYPNHLPLQINAQHVPLDIYPG